METLCLVKEARHKRPHSVLFCLYEMSRTGKSIKTESRLVFAKGQGVGVRGVTANGYRVSFVGDENVML